MGRENWLVRICQKPMALPYSTEKETDPGTRKIDEFMDPDTAFGELQLYPDIEFFDAGSEGLVSRIGSPGVLMKYTPEANEVEAAEVQFEKKYPFVVQILEPPRRIQQNPDLWAIKMKEVKPLDWPHKDIISSLYRALYRHDQEYPEVEQVIEDWHTLMKPPDIVKLYNDYTTLIGQLKRHFWVADVHGRNVGYQDGRMVIFDLGGYGKFYI